MSYSLAPVWHEGEREPWPGSGEPCAGAAQAQEEASVQLHPPACGMALGPPFARRASVCSLRKMGWGMQCWVISMGVSMSAL